MVNPYNCPYFRTPSLRIQPPSLGARPQARSPAPRAGRDHLTVPGEIEDDDPGESGLHAYSTFTFADGDDVPALDVEDMVDRLRFMGLEHGLITEADQRLRDDPRRGMEWLERRLEELEPARQPPSCDCGEVLVGVDFRGRATVRCSACGSRWGVDVVDEESESFWQISGPTEEWLAAHPLDEQSLYGAFQPEEILSEGLPPLPTGGIEPGSYFPLATWRHGDRAAVLYLHRRPAGESWFPGDSYEDETEHLVIEDGEWQSTGSGGGSWVNALDPPADLLDKYVVLGTDTTGIGDGDDGINFTGGVCSSRVAVIETTDRTGSRRYAIADGRRFFVVGVFGRGTVRGLGADGEVLLGHRGDALEFGLG